MSHVECFQIILKTYTISGNCTNCHFIFVSKILFFTQHLNHNSHCKQCPGNLVLTLDWNYMFVQISMHTHYFNSCTQIFEMFLAFEINITWHTFIFIVVLDILYKYTDFCYGKGGQSSPQCYCSITNKTICNCLWITTMRLGHTTMILWWTFFCWNCNIHKKLHKRHNLHCYLIWISWCSNFLQFVL